MIKFELVSGMGSMHAWETQADGIAPDIQAVAKGLGGGYASIGAVLMSQKIADGIRDQNGFWKHGHTYQVSSSPSPYRFESKVSLATVI